MSPAACRAPPEVVVVVGGFAHFRGCWVLQAVWARQAEGLQPRSRLAPLAVSQSPYGLSRKPYGFAPTNNIFTNIFTGCTSSPGALDVRPDVQIKEKSVWTLADCECRALAPGLKPLRLLCFKALHWSRSCLYSPPTKKNQIDVRPSHQSKEPRP